MAAIKVMSEDPAALMASGSFEKPVVSAFVPSFSLLGEYLLTLKQQHVAPVLFHFGWQGLAISWVMKMVVIKAPMPLSCPA